MKNTSNYALNIEKLTKKYENFMLDNVSFSLPKGRIMGLIGENGAGKSTTIRCILGLAEKDGGRVSIDGKYLSDDRENILGDIGVVFDEINFYGGLTPYQVGKISKAAYKKWDSTLYKSYLERFSLPEKKKLREFSRGMKMKLSIAVALSHAPKLLILDEATSGLDPVMRDDILDIFLEFVGDEEHSILLSSHITTDLEKVADYITFIHDGKVIFSKEKDELRYRYGILRCGEEEFSKIEKNDILAYRKEAYQYSVLISDKESAAAKYRDAVIDSATVDEIMLIYVKGALVK